MIAVCLLLLLLPVFFPGSETKFDQDTADTTGLSMQLSEQLLQQSVSCRGAGHSSISTMVMCTCVLFGANV